MGRLFIASIILVVWAYSSPITESAASIEVRQCNSIGKSCGIQRDNESDPKKVIMRPCCGKLVCLGAGPNEILNNGGSAHHSDKLLTLGICSLNLDNDQATADQAEYKE